MERNVLALSLQHRCVLLYIRDSSLHLQAMAAEYIEEDERGSLASTLSVKVYKYPPVHLPFTVNLSEGKLEDGGVPPQSVRRHVSKSVVSIRNSRHPADLQTLQRGYFYIISRGRGTNAKGGTCADLTKNQDRAMSFQVLFHYSATVGHLLWT